MTVARQDLRCGKKFREFCPVITETLEQTTLPDVGRAVALLLDNLREEIPRSDAFCSVISDTIGESVSC